MNTTLAKALTAAGLATAIVVPAQLSASAASEPARASARVAACTNADLDASFRSTDAGAGHRYGLLRLTNVSDDACRTGGYGALSYVGHGNGTQVGAAADRDRGTVRIYVLQPGDRVKSLVDAVVAQNYPRARCRPTHVDGFGVYATRPSRSSSSTRRPGAPAAPCT